MAKKDLTEGMKHGLASLLTPTETPEEKQETKTTKKKQPTETAEPEPLVPVGVKKKYGSGMWQQKKKATAPSITNGLQEGYTRATIICKIETLAKIKEIAYRERGLVKDVVETALAEMVERYEAENGKIKLPKNK